jgi:UDP:flavonoid glycosyltransferase YjiC (YdhE family)
MRGPYVERLNAGHVAKVEAGLERVASVVGFERAPSLADYLTHPRRYFDCIPETDPYGARDDVAYVGPLNALPGREPPEWPQAGHLDGPCVFAYLRGGPLADRLLSALGGVGARVLCVSTGTTPGVPATYRGQVRITRQTVDLTTAAREADLVVSYAPLGLLTQACIAGAPQLLAPTDMEKMLAAWRVTASGRGVTVQGSNRVSEALGAARQITIAPLQWNGAPGPWLERAFA